MASIGYRLGLRNPEVVVFLSFDCLGREWAFSLNFSDNCFHYSFGGKNQSKCLVRDLLPP